MRLYQDRVWTTKDGETLRLEDMTPNHRRRTLCYLRLHARAVKFNYELDLILGPQPVGEMACDMFDAGLRELEEQPAMEWLNETPLVTRLAQMVAGDQRWPR